MGSDWYVSRDGKTFGPFTSEQMSAGVRDGQLKREDFVWRAPMPDWQAASEAPGLWRPPPLPAAPAVAVPTREAEGIETSPASAEGSPGANEPKEPERAVGTTQDARPQSGFIRRHWRGELTLAQAYWGVGLLLSLVVVGLAYVFAEWLRQANLPPVGLGIALTSSLSFLCVMTVWQLVGTWRAAGNHIVRTRRRLWATLARVAVVLGALRAFGDFTMITGPMLSESVKLVTGREDTPPHRLRLLSNGTAVELAGGMPFGTAQALRTLLEAAPSVRVLHLNSIGGRVSEGYEIFKMVRDRGLTTYTTTECVSACTIAFLGGSQRYLSNRGRLGFHSTSFGSVDQQRLPEINDDLRRMLAEHGAPLWFIDKALSTRADSMWYPPTKDLIDAKIVTQVVDPDWFVPATQRRDAAKTEACQGNGDDLQQALCWLFSVTGQQ